MPHTDKISGGYAYFMRYEGKFRNTIIFNIIIVKIQ